MHVRELCELAVTRREFWGLKSSLWVDGPHVHEAVLFVGCWAGIARATRGRNTQQDGEVLGRGEAVCCGGDAGTRNAAELQGGGDNVSERVRSVCVEATPPRTLGTLGAFSGSRRLAGRGVRTGWGRAAVLRSCGCAVQSGAAIEATCRSAVKAIDCTAAGGSQTGTVVSNGAWRAKQGTVGSPVWWSWCAERCSLQSGSPQLRASERATRACTCRACGSTAEEE